VREATPGAALLDSQSVKTNQGELRRLSRDFAYEIESSEALIDVDMSHLMLHRRMTSATALFQSSWMTFTTVSVALV
jgi:hypothetical protein